MNKSKGKWKTVIVIILFIFVWLWDVIFAYRYGETYLDADMASEMVLANKTNEAGVYLDTDWFYSSEIRILGQIMLFKPLLLLFPDDWGLVRVIAQAFFLLAAGLSYIYMTSILGNIRKSIFFAALLLCPFGYWHMWHDCFDGFYLIWIIFYSFLAGLIFRLSFKRGRYRWLQWMSLVALSFVCGLQSIRVFNNLLIPLAAAAFIIAYLNLRQTGEDTVFHKVRIFVVTTISCMCAAVGYFINHKVLSNIYTYTNQDTRLWQEFSITSLLNLLENFIQLFGYPYNSTQSMEIPLFSWLGLLSCFGILLTVFFVGGFVVGIKKYKIFSAEEKAIFWTAIMAIAVQMVIFAFFMSQTEFNGSYFLPSLCLYIALLQIAVTRFSYVDCKRGSAILSMLILVTAVLSGINTQLLFLKYPTRSHSELVKVAETLKEQGYNQVVSTFWRGNNLTELTDGYVEVWVTHEMNLEYINKCLQSKSHLTTRPYERYAYVYETEVYNRDESQHSLWDNNENAHIVYQDDIYTVVGVEE